MTNTLYHRGVIRADDGSSSSAPVNQSVEGAAEPVPIGSSNIDELEPTSLHRNQDRINAKGKGVILSVIEKSFDNSEDEDGETSGYRTMDSSFRSVFSSDDVVESVLEVQNEEKQSGGERDSRRRSRPNPRLSNPPKNIHGEQVAAGWPSWLSMAELQESESAGSGGNIDELEENLVQTNQERLEVKGVVLSVIRRACFGIGRTVSLIVRPGLSSEFEMVVEKQDDPISDGSGSGIVFTSKVASASGGHSVSFSVSSGVEIWSGSSVFEKSVKAGWPSWLLEFAGEALKGWTPRKPDSFRKLARIGDGKDSLVYKARDILTGKIVALRKFLFTVMPESVKSMAREVLILRRLDHPNVVKLEGLVTSRNSYYAYLIFEYMEHDMTGLSARSGIKFTVPQVKFYIHQLISGLEHCHNRGVVHCDIQRSNLLLNNQGMLKIAGFGSASLTDLYDKQPMTGHVGTLYYRSPELLLGAINYGIGVDLWSTGCILAELLAGKPIMRGCTEVDQLHQIFKLFGSPTEKCWGSLQLRYPSIFKPIHPYTRCIVKTFQNFPRSSLQLIETLLAFDPAERQTATTALRNEFFTTEPYACEPSSLPQYPPSTEMAAKLRHKVAQRVSALSGSLIGELQIEDSMFWPCRDNNVDVFSDTAAIKTDTLDDTIGISTVSLDDIINRLLKVRTWKPGKQFHLSEAEIHQLCTASREIFLQQPNLLELEAPINICGNIHGHYSDLLRLFDYGDLPHKAKYLFLGNYVDHGNGSLETMCHLLAYKVKYPDKLFLLRGNHECASDSKIHGFYEDCRYHFGRRVCDAFNDCFDCLPVAAIVADKIFCVSGGLSPDLTSLDQIRNLTRPTGVPKTGLLCDLIWSGPSRYVKGWGLNDRGISYSFGSDKVSEFLTKHDLGLICRSHQVMEEVMEDGYEFFADRQLVTIFSASNYCGELDNSGAMMSVDKRLVCSFKVLKPGEGTKVKK